MKWLTILLLVVENMSDNLKNLLIEANQLLDEIEITIENMFRCAMASNLSKVGSQ